MSKLLRLTFGLVLGGIFLFLCIRNVKWVDVKDIVVNIKPGWVALSLLCYWLELWLRIGRWRHLLSRAAGPADGKLTCAAFLAGYAANNILPAKLGELFRADLFGRLTNTSRLTALGSIILERLLDMTVILGMAAWGLFFMPKSGIQDQIGHLLAAMGGLLTIGVIVILAVLKTQARWGTILLGRLNEKFHNIMDGLHLLGDASSYARLVSSSAIIWLLNSLAIWFILMAVGVTLNFSQSMLLMGMIGISAAIPAAPAGVGTLQYAFYLVFIMLELPASTGFVASILVQLALLGSATIVGGWLYHYAITARLMPARK